MHGAPPGPPAPAWPGGRTAQAKGAAGPLNVGPPAPAWSSRPAGAGSSAQKTGPARISIPGQPRTIQRQLIIGGQSYDSNDAEFLFDKIYNNSFSNDPKLITQMLARYLGSQEFMFENMTSFIWELNMRLLKAEKPSTFSMQPVEKNIFQFWAGGPLSPGALQSVKGWIAKAKKNGWTHSFVTDFALNKHFHSRVLKTKGMIFTTTTHLSDQIEQLHALGSRIMDASTLDSPRYKSLQKITLEEGRFGEIPFMSDLVRFYVLHKYGGLYMDVDVAPGSVDLGGYTTISNIPYLGPMLRTTKDAKEAGVLGAQGLTLEKKLLALFGKNDVGRGMHYMMSAKGSPAMKDIFDIANTTEILGNGAVIKGIATHFRKNVGLSNLENIMTLTMPPDLPKIGWITDESDSIVN